MLNVVDVEYSRKALLIIANYVDDDAKAVLRYLRINEDTKKPQKPECMADEFDMKDNKAHKTYKDNSLAIEVV